MSGYDLQESILNPVVPYVGTIHGGLKSDTMVEIHGTVPNDATRFQIDFQCGGSEVPRSDVAFHFNPRFKGSGQIVCNTLENEKWGSEEKTYQMPFTKGNQFQVIFLVLRHKFQVSSNGRHLLSYRHRIKLDKIDTLGIYGNVNINSIGFVSEKRQQGIQSITLPANLVDGCLKVPFTHSLSSPLGPGRTVLVKGEVNKNAKSFAIDLKPSGHKNIALHLNPRMKEKVFVRNSYLFDSWGTEERQLHEFPFFPDMYFELLIYCEAHQFKVALNGQHLLEYRHRYKDLSAINEISVQGDVEVYDFRVW
ncbi:galectin-8 [Mantella aurantiaca]